ncbi:sugar ABC transporter permease, partial [Rhizobium sp. BR5]
FAVFAFLPILLNMAYSVTGSEHILLSERPSVGGENFSVLLLCQNYFDPNSCQRDLFWRSVWNTLFFVVLQVGFMVGFSLITAIVLNR